MTKTNNWRAERKAGPLKRSRLVLICGLLLATVACGRSPHSIDLRINDCNRKNGGSLEGWIILNKFKLQNFTGERAPRFELLVEGLDKGERITLYSGRPQTAEQGEKVFLFSPLTYIPNYRHKGYGILRGGISIPTRPKIKLGSRRLRVTAFVDGRDEVLFEGQPPFSTHCPN